MLVECEMCNKKRNGEEKEELNSIASRGGHPTTNEFLFFAAEFVFNVTGGKFAGVDVAWCLSGVFVKEVRKKSDAAKKKFDGKL